MRHILPKLAAAPILALGLISLTPAASFADSHISTGSSSTNVSISNNVNSNFARVGGGREGDIFINISGNGSRSHNSVDVDLNGRTSVNQSNAAFISNDVSVNSNTGGNSVSDDNDNGRVRHMRFCAWHPWSVWCR